VQPVNTTFIDDLPVYAELYGSKYEISKLVVDEAVK